MTENTESLEWARATWTPTIPEQRLAEQVSDLQGTVDEQATRLRSTTRRGNPTDLTAREVEVLAFIADGMPTEDIAARLFIARSTCRNHLASIYTKLDAHSKMQAVNVARTRGYDLTRPDEG